MCPLGRIKWKRGRRGKGRRVKTNKRIRIRNREEIIIINDE